MSNPQAFNSAKGPLKLGPSPLDDELRTEVERVVRERSVLEGGATSTVPFDIQSNRPAAPGTVAPTEADLLPHPPSFRTYDLNREVNAAQDARKRIRLEPSVLNSTNSMTPQANELRARALPSICSYTLHDVAEGSVV